MRTILDMDSGHKHRPVASPDSTEISFDDIIERLMHYAHFEPARSALTSKTSAKTKRDRKAPAAER